ncbi:DUF928 domain-containing protein [Dapis sp. BLCC M126]|uniref:DUF928 domain-containing protein n=1 Tax=Dapis sp. BLCC M126 TaxID=3400189 RepID=UPI003CED3952
MKLNFHLTILATVALLTPIWLTSVVNAEIEISQLELIVQKTRFRTPDMRETSGRTTPGGTRGSFLSPENTPTALIPETNIGLTLAEYPTFFVYLPAMVGKTGEFWLVTEDGNVIYETKFTLVERNGIISVNLPDDGSIPPLKVGQKYEWGMAIVLDPNDRISDSLASGWVQRIEASPSLSQELQNTTPDNHPKIYAEAGIWHETLDSLAKLRQSNPNNSTFITQWQDILESVGLEAVADAPLLGDTNQLTQPPQKSGGSLRAPDTRESPLVPPPSAPTPRSNMRVPDMTPIPIPKGGGTR